MSVEETGKSRGSVSTGVGRSGAKVYTRHGDGGLTDVPALGRAPKDSPRVVACGSLDELNCMIGELRARVGESSIAAGAKRTILRRLARIQREVLSVGALVSGGVSPDRGATARQRTAIRRIEAEIDEMQETLPALRGFILPGGDPLSAGAHLARAFCRRAERAGVAALGADPPGGIVVPYLNRLSDWFFVLARWLSNELGRADEPWRKRRNANRRGKRE